MTRFPPCSCTGCRGNGIAPSGMCPWCDETMHVHQHCTSCGAPIIVSFEQMKAETGPSRTWEPPPRTCDHCAASSKR